MLNKLNLDKKIVRFLLIGGCNTLLGFGLFPTVYWLMTGLRKHYIWMLMFCHVINVTWAYFSNKYWVFCTQGQTLCEMTKFMSFHILCFLFMLVCMPILVEYAHLSPVIIQFFISILVVLCSYFWYNKIVFFAVENK